MPRRKDPAKVKSTKYTVDELMLYHGIDPLDEMLEIYNQEIPYPVDVDGKFMAEEFKHLIESGWEVSVTKKGDKVMRLSVQRRVDLLKELAQYVHPKLRGQEIRGSVDHNINLTIRTYEIKGATVVAAPLTDAAGQRAIEAEVVHNESD